VVQVAPQIPSGASETVQTGGCPVEHTRRKARTVVDDIELSNTIVYLKAYLDRVSAVLDRIGKEVRQSLIEKNRHRATNRQRTNIRSMKPKTLSKYPHLFAEQFRQWHAFWCEQHSPTPSHNNVFKLIDILPEVVRKVDALAHQDKPILDFRVEPVK